jgi:hypothetical protein
VIERNIWQTYETPIEDLPDYAVFCIKSWKTKNREWKHNYMSGQQREDFVRDEYGGDIYEAYMRMPMGVMKAGIWRFLILYRYGGIYADLDTECVQKIRNWLPNDYEMVVDIEGDTPWYATQVIAAKSGHPFLKDAIDLCVERMKLNDWTIPNMVHHYTDVAMFTDSLMNSLKLPPHEGDLRIKALEYNETKKAKEHKFFTFAGEDARCLLDKHVRHLYWGDVDRKEGYIAWKADPIVNQSYKDGFDPKDWKEG